MDHSADGTSQLFGLSSLKSYGGLRDHALQGTGPVNHNYTVPDTPITPSGDGILDDYTALVQLYFAAGGANWTIKSGWYGTSTDPCGDGWQGAICGPAAPEPDCDAGSSCGLCLKPIAYPATECPDFNTLQTMPACDLAPVGGLCEADGECGTSDTLNNCGDGYDVYRKAVLPANATQQRVSRLLLSGNNLNGVIPPHLAMATHLQEIDFSDNSLTGSLPTELALLTVLETFAATSNGLTGVLPPQMFSDGSAWRPARCGGHLGRGGIICGDPAVYLSHNSISGTLPSELGSLRTTAKTFYCGDGSLAAASPSSDGVDYCSDTTKCPCGPCCYCSCQLPIQLQRVHLQHNKISGALPTELGRVELALPLLEQPFNQGRSTSRLSGKLQELRLHSNRLTGVLPSQLGNLTSLRELMLKDNSISGTVPDSVRANESWPNSYGVRGPGGPGVPSELGVSALRYLSLENNRLSGTVPPSLVPCVALVDLHRSVTHNLLSGSTPLEINGHTGASQRLEGYTEDSVYYEASDIPMQQRMRKFRVKRPAVGAVSEPNFETYESRDYCMFSPNVLFRCAPPDGAPGQGVSYSDTGGIRRCETSFTIPPTPPDVQLKRSGMYNHRFLAEVSGEVYETHSSEWKWRRPPHPWERDDSTPPPPPASPP